MHLLILTGFLGSGKTTLLRRIAQAFNATCPDKRMAVIENEVGTVGIDGDFLANDGLTVRQINSGCICCTLRLDLVTTLLDLERTYAPDLIILEPSGVAGPRQVLSALDGLWW